MVIFSGQSITTSAEVTLNGGLVRESPQNPLNSGLGIILICPDFLGFKMVYDLISQHCPTSTFVTFEALDGRQGTMDLSQKVTLLPCLERDLGFGCLMFAVENRGLHSW